MLLSLRNINKCGYKMNMKILGSYFSTLLSLKFCGLAPSVSFKPFLDLKQYSASEELEQSTLYFLDSGSITELKV